MGTRCPAICRRLLFGFRSAICSKEFIRFFLELIIEQKSGKEDVCDESKQNKQLGPGGFLDILFRFCVAYFARAVLCFFLVDQLIYLTGQADAKGGFKEQKYQAHQADDAGYRTIGIDHYHKNEHGARKGYAHDPGKLFLFGSDILRYLVFDDQSTNDQGWREFGIDKDPDDKISKEERDRIFCQQKIIIEEDKDQGHENKQEEYPCRGPYFSFVQHRDIISRHFFPELDQFAH